MVQIHPGPPLQAERAPTNRRLIGRYPRPLSRSSLLPASEARSEPKASEGGQGGVYGRYPAWFGAVAQLGERGLCKPEVVGSIPISSTTFFAIPSLEEGRP